MNTWAELDRIVDGVIRSSNFMLRWASRIAVLLLLGVLATAAYFPGYVLFILLAFVIAVTYILTKLPLVTIAIGVVFPTMVRIVLGIVGLAFFMGAYIQLFVANSVTTNRQLTFFLGLTVFAYAALRAAKFSRFLRGLLVIAMILTTVIFAIGNASKKSKEKSVVDKAIAQVLGPKYPTYRERDCEGARGEKVHDIAAALAGLPDADPDQYTAHGLENNCWGMVWKVPPSFSSGWCFLPPTEEDEKDESQWIAAEFLDRDGNVVSSVYPHGWKEAAHKNDIIPVNQHPESIRIVRFQGNAPHGVLLQRGHWSEQTRSCRPSYPMGQPAGIGSPP